jgi:hypothetical protein
MPKPSARRSSGFVAAAKSPGIAVRLGFQPTAWANPIEIAVDVELQQIRRGEGEFSHSSAHGQLEAF